MLIDEFMFAWDAREQHSIAINASAREIFQAAQQMDLRRARLTNFCFRLRGLRGVSARADSSLANLLKMGFVRLGEKPDEEFLLGLTGKFWQPNGELIRVEKDDFVGFDKPGYAKAVWNFSLAETDGAAIRLTTETRIVCTDAQSRRRFRLYWFFIGWFSGLIRREMFAVIKDAAENGDRNQQSGNGTFFDAETANTD